jgi:DNA-binding transcriptional ArsR family regulator
MVSRNLPLVRTYLDPFDALGDPTRRAVFELLRKGPQPVVAIAAQVTVSRPAVSQHLRVLKDAGLVTDTAVGNKRLYAVSSKGLESARSYLESFWDGVLTEFRQAVEAQPKEEEDDGD